MNGRRRNLLVFAGRLAAIAVVGFVATWVALTLWVWK